MGDGGKGHNRALGIGGSGSRGIVSVASKMKPGMPVLLVPRGLEPRTLRLLAVRSDQLSYETF